MTPTVMKRVDGGTPSHGLKVWANRPNTARMNRLRPKLKNRRRNLGIPPRIAVEIIGGLVDHLRTILACVSVPLYCTFSSTA
jgi:hypothetical protein